MRRDPHPRSEALDNLESRGEPPRRKPSTGKDGANAPALTSKHSDSKGATGYKEKIVSAALDPGQSIAASPSAEIKETIGDVAQEEPMEESKEQIIKGPWSNGEDEKLMLLVQQFGPKRWSMIASHMPGRIGKQAVLCPSLFLSQLHVHN